MKVRYWRREQIIRSSRVTALPKTGDLQYLRTVRRAPFRVVDVQTVTDNDIDVVLVELSDDGR